MNDKNGKNDFDLLGDDKPAKPEDRAADVYGGVVRIKNKYSGVEQDAKCTIRRDGNKIGRNQPCPCGSRKKAKFCCGGTAGKSMKGQNWLVRLKPIKEEK